jgi:hypothetical protein
MMKMTKLFKLAFALALPLTTLSCGDKEEDQKSGDGSAEVESDSHAKIAEEISTVMNGMMDQLMAIKTTEAANDFGGKMEGYVSSLKDLLARAKKLPAPTSDDVAAVQKVKEMTDGKAKEMAQTLQTNLESHPEDAAAISAVLGNVMQNEEMSSTMKEFEELYELDDSSEEPNSEGEPTPEGEPSPEE